jgi:hypothetical protein
VRTPLRQAAGAVEEMRSKHSTIKNKMKKYLIIALLFATATIFAQLPQLRPEVVELYRLQDIAKQSRVLNSDDFIAKHEAFFAHPLFCEIAFGKDYIDFAEALLIQGNHEKAEKYFLKSAKSHYLTTSNMFAKIFNKRENWWIDTSFIIPRTPENIKFKETVIEKILEIEEERTIGPRIIVILQELRDIEEKDQAIRWISPRNTEYEELWSILADSVKNRRMTELSKELANENLDIIKVDSMNISRIIELIRENPDIDVLRIKSEIDIMGVVLWHSFRLRMRYARTAWTDFFEPYWRKQAENGKGLEYCYWYDVYHWHIKQDIPYYGIYNISSIELYDEDIEKINERREKIGLLPLTK